MANLSDPGADGLNENSAHFALDADAGWKSFEFFYCVAKLQ